MGKEDRRIGGVGKREKDKLDNLLWLVVSIANLIMTNNNALVYLKNYQGHAIHVPFSLFIRFSLPTFTLIFIMLLSSHLICHFQWVRNKSNWVELGLTHLDLLIYNSDWGWHNFFFSLNLTQFKFMNK